MRNSTTINRIDQDDALNAYTQAEQNAGLNDVLDDLDRMIDTTEKAITGHLQETIMKTTYQDEDGNEQDIVIHVWVYNGAFAHSDDALSIVWLNYVKAKLDQVGLAYTRETDFGVKWSDDLRSQSPIYRGGPCIRVCSDQATPKLLSFLRDTEVAANRARLVADPCPESRERLAELIEIEKLEDQGGRVSISLCPTCLERDGDMIDEDVLLERITAAVLEDYPKARVEIQVARTQGNEWYQINGKDSDTIRDMVLALDWADESLYLEAENKDGA